MINYLNNRAFGEGESGLESTVTVEMDSDDTLRNDDRQLSGDPQLGRETNRDSNSVAAGSKTGAYCPPLRTETANSVATPRSPNSSGSMDNFWDESFQEDFRSESLDEDLEQFLDDLVAGPFDEAGRVRTLRGR